MPTAFKQADFPSEYGQQQEPQQQQQQHQAQEELPQPEVQELEQEQESLPRSLPPSEPIVPENAESQVPEIYTMATTTHTIPTQDLNGNTNEHANFGTTQDHDDNYLADKAGGLSLAEEGQADYDHGLANGNHDTNFKGPYEEEAPAGYTGGNAVLGDAIGRDSQDYAQSDAQTTQTRPS